MSVQRGFSLIEIIVFMLVIGIGLSGIAALYVQTVKQSHDPQIRGRAIAVAQAYMDEIWSRRFDENSPQGGGCVETGSGSCDSFCGALTVDQCGQNGCRWDGLACGKSADASADLGSDSESRDEYDDIDDYHGLTEAPSGISGAVGGFEGFGVQVVVMVPSANWNNIAAADVRRIQVSVSTPTSEQVRLISWRINF